jgi:2-keto-4-pentenoate hydratase/2-oxohepta-3-ene-1,7-dioic acid hydratase in catechol pathway
MKLCRFRVFGSPDGAIRDGVLEGDKVHEVKGAWPAGLSRTSESWPLDRVKLSAPIATPSKIVGMAKNYRKHAEEMGSAVPLEPLIFLKAPSSIIGPGDTIELPPESVRVDYEGELAVVIGRKCSRIAPGEAIEPYIAGFTCLNDVSARDFQKKDGLFARAKGYDTFCPVGPVLETEFDWRKAHLQTLVNGKVHQYGDSSEMLFAIDEQMRFISNVMTLLPGDVIATGTPEGIGPLAAGDVVEIVIDGIGKLSNPVAMRKG